VLDLLPGVTFSESTVLARCLHIVQKLVYVAALPKQYSRLLRSTERKAEARAMNARASAILAGSKTDKPSVVEDQILIHRLERARMDGPAARSRFSSAALPLSTGTSTGFLAMKRGRVGFTMAMATRYALPLTRPTL
jgi:hypothetical protein